ncbi:uncharacterized protein BYT42DRAFT_564500 [Radiomyces spectabilis]|uniref:uncharacterized protein n=1 Tax=Radiomyces spectabilis TaxID=64574 RepID=UPI00221EC7FC|nr:uncharacterized protein BYT42DRAFT_564500 [Radiomyces spectabilis]KAI8385048.1 hypothetical protein BYT42DRAFT_564500 [Radiomyces spectabilis]
MSQPYQNFISPLDSLIFDVAVDPFQTEQEAAEDLALWTNAQFTFDVKPGVGIYDEDKPCNSSTAPSSSSTPFVPSANQFDNDLEPITYEKLVNYLDYELPQQQQQKHQQRQQQQQTPRPQIPFVESAPVRPLAPSLSQPTGSRQLLPKPPVLDASQLASLLTQPTAVTPQRKKSTQTASKRSRPTEEKDDESVAAEEDKRRRNTAASARFRVKKKMREQAMEQTVRDMTSKAEALQNRVNELELEVKWLRNLLTEKETPAAHSSS